MSKQSRARARRHKKKGTGMMAPTIIITPTMQYNIMGNNLDELHRELLKKKDSWGMHLIDLFYCELWSELTECVSSQRKSKSKERVLNMILDVKIQLAENNDYINNK